MVTHRLFKIIVIGLIVWAMGLAFGPSVWALEDQEAKAKSLALYAMGIIYDLYGETDKAIEEFQKSVGYGDNYAVRLRLGADYARLGKLQKAIDDLTKALEFDKDNVQARYLLALIYSTQKDYDQAAKQYEAILSSFVAAQPENVEIYGYLAQLYYSQKEYDKAIQQFEAVLSLEPDNSDVMFLLGALYLETKNEQKAMELFEMTLQYDPANDSCLNSLGYLYAEKGVKLDEAKVMIEQALLIDPQNGAYLDSLGWVYFKQGDHQKALEYLLKALNVLEDPEIYKHISQVYHAMGDSAKADEYWQRALGVFQEGDPQGPDAIKLEDNKPLPTL
ncbi:MAG TPA: tetratricopeptide repeat protein [Candidatus Omnitrophota bacterium]|nr:tetratricopeptide repeat protein [Candidatus Omnitrophota bacterium]